MIFDPARPLNLADQRPETSSNGKKKPHIHIEYIVYPNIGEQCDWDNDYLANDDRT